MVTEKLQKAINGQITAEMWSANLYLAMSFHAAHKGWPGMAHWLERQWREENGHACRLAAYLLQRGAKPVVDKVDVVPNDFGTPLEMFTQVYRHECRVSKMIEALVELAAEEKDLPTQDFLWGFVREQVEEEAAAMGIMELMEHAGESGLLYADARLGKRE